MIYKLLGGGPEDALNGTTAIHAISLQKGANILRVHDVKAATEVVRIMAAMQKNIKPSCQPSKTKNKDAFRYSYHESEGYSGYPPCCLSAIQDL